MNDEQRSLFRIGWLLTVGVIVLLLSGAAGYALAESAEDSDPGPKLVCVSSAGPVTIEPGEGAPTITGDSRIDCWEGDDLP